ncbi:MAG: hypothetical protein JXL80_14510 [Planctomycetes bacterium]|nr:hypothetical protein [Planctomycetota bacterium]
MDSTTILAASDLISAVGAIIVMIIIGGLQVLAKWKQEKERRERDRRRELEPQQASPRQQPQTPQRSVRGQREMTPLEKMQAYGRRAAQSAPPAVQGQGARSQRVVRRAPYQTGRPAGVPITLRPQPDQDDTLRVDAELRHEQQRLAQEELERQRRLADLQSQVVVRHVRTARPTVSAEGFLETPESAERGIEVDLQDAEVARRAIIFQEIFSPPVSLRSGRASWDL